MIEFNDEDKEHQASIEVKWMGIGFFLSNRVIPFEAMRQTIASIIQFVMKVSIEKVRVDCFTF